MMTTLYNATYTEELGTPHPALADWQEMTERGSRTASLPLRKAIAAETTIRLLAATRLTIHEWETIQKYRLAENVR